MSVFTLDLVPEDRELLERHRARLGLRSHADTVRFLIRDAVEEPVYTGPLLDMERLVKNTQTFGPQRPAPGSRLKGKK